jgi:hypothetical protein
MCSVCDSGIEALGLMSDLRVQGFAWKEMKIWAIHFVIGVQFLKSITVLNRLERSLVMWRF